MTKVTYVAEILAFPLHLTFLFLLFYTYSYHFPPRAPSEALNFSFHHSAESTKPDAYMKAETILDRQTANTEAKSPRCEEEDRRKMRRNHV